MEVEIKLTLTKADTEKLQHILQSKLETVHEQINTFLDTTLNQLEKDETVLRLRRSKTLYSKSNLNPTFTDSNNTTKWMVAIKSKPKLENGINRVSEVESEISDDITQILLKDPSAVHSSVATVHPLLLQISTSYPGPFHILGSYQTKRSTYTWEDGLSLELDETYYSSGKEYFELECETKDPDSVKALLTKFLDSHNIHYENSRMNKFALMRSEQQ